MIILIILFSKQRNVVVITALLYVGFVITYWYFECLFLFVSFFS